MIKILIVDDDRHFIQKVRRLLAGFGYGSDFITGAERLFPKLEQEAVDLILLDIHMPGTDGVTQLKELKDHPLHQNIPVIILTVEIDEQVLANCFKYGAADFISKPVQDLVLKARVESALAIQTYIKALEDRTADLNKANEQLQHEISDRVQAEDELQKYREHLEELVEERTAEVRKVNEQLEQEIIVKMQTEEALLESQARYRAIVEGNSDLICRFLPDMTLTFVNDAYCRYFGKTRDEFIGKRFLALVSGEARDAVRENVQSFLESKQENSHEHKVIAPNGDIRWQRWTNRPILDDSERIVEFQAVGRDTTERKQAEEALRIEQSFLKNIIDLNPYAITIKDSEGYHLSENQAFRDLFNGVPPDEYTIFDDEVFKMAGIQNQIKKVRDGEIIILPEIWYDPHYVSPEHSGVNVCFQSVLFPLLDERGKVQRIVVMLEDITVRKQAAEELKKHRDHLEELIKERTINLEKTNMELKETQSKLVQSAKLASIGELTAGVTHELNQPLMYIRSNAQLETMEGLENLNPQSAYETLKIVEEGTDRMMTIIDHLRNFARQADFGFKHIQLNDVLENSFTFFNQQFRLCPILIEKDYAERLPDVWGNANQLEQVFINMLSNAKDALTEREDAILKIKTQFQQTGDGTGNAVVQFTDNERGIPQSIFDKIFDPFFTTKEVGEGTGLGLSISYGFVKDHKSDITVSSVEAEGTTFEISLPVINALNL